MFVTNHNSGYTRDGSQFAQGYFLMLMQPNSHHCENEACEGYKLPVDGEWDRCEACGEFMTIESDAPIRGLVRFVRMTQLGHFMMGAVRVKGHKLVLSGAYGEDGLIMTVPRDVYNLGKDLPAELVEQWNRGGGWNSAGSEADDMRKWARANFLRRIRANHTFADRYDRWRRTA